MSPPRSSPYSPVHPELLSYLEGLDPGADPLLQRLEDAAHSRDFPLVGRATGRLMELLARAIGARRVLELGSGFGYSAYFFARAVGEGGEVVATEKDPWELDHHRALYADDPLARRIRYRLGSALQTLAEEPGPFDVVFMDIDKESYEVALNGIAATLRPNGLLMVDNVVWGGKVSRASSESSTRALQSFNRALIADPRFEAVILPVGDGLALARRR